MRASTKLRRLIEGDDVIVAPGCYDGLSARLVEGTGFPAVYVSGGAMARSTGIPDMGLLSPSEIAARLAQIVDAIGIPAIADMDTGFGNALNARHAIRAFERAGVAGFHRTVNPAYRTGRHVLRFGHGRRRAGLARLLVAVALEANPEKHQGYGDEQNLGKGKAEHHGALRITVPAPGPRVARLPLPR